jgi:hypothetical protein
MRQCKSRQQKKTALAKILDVMRDGEARTIRRVAYLADVGPNCVRRAVRDGFLVKIGEEPRPPGPLVRCGQAVVKIAPPKEAPCGKSRRNQAPLAA